MWFPDCVLFLTLLRKENHKIFLYKKQDHSGNRNNIWRNREKSVETLLTIEYQEYRYQRWNCRVHDVKITSTKLIEMFEKHQHKEQFLKDMSQKQEINTFSEESQKLLVDMNHTGVFELYEISAKLQRPDCNVFSDIGIIYYSCKRNLKYKRSPTTSQKTNYVFTSILTLSLRRIPVEAQSTTHLKDRSCSSRRRRYLRKQDNQSTTIIQRFS